MAKSSAGHQDSAVGEVQHLSMAALRHKRPVARSKPRNGLAIDESWSIIATIVDIA